MTPRELIATEIRSRWSEFPLTVEWPAPDRLRIDVGEGSTAVDIAEWLVDERGFVFAGMAVREHRRYWRIHYLFYDHGIPGLWIQVSSDTSREQPLIPSLASRVHAADWHEREAEDHFGILFEGHPRLGDFVLHDEEWPEGISPMRKSFDASERILSRGTRPDWSPRRILQEPGAFAMTVGPIYGGLSEPVHFLLETTGENVVRAFPRLFFKYRAIEKRAEGLDVNGALLLAERFSATTAFASSFAFCQAVETMAGIEAPPRARTLRVLLAELERLRRHVGSIRGICGSTALAVAESRAGYLEEELLRLSGEIGGHRYLFGLNVPGGLAADLADGACRLLAERLAEIEHALASLRRMLGTTSSFLDRLEEVGVVTSEEAGYHGLVGPVARASNIVCDLRAAHPYSGYERFAVAVPHEEEGDGYARLRVLFDEALESARIIRSAARDLPSGAVRTPIERAPRNAWAFGAVEAPGGASIHWLWLDEEGRVERYRIVPPSFVNWHGFHLAAEGFAFQDFPIILSTFALSVAESDR